MGVSSNKNPPVIPGRYAVMGVEVIRYLPPSGQLNICQIHAYPKYTQIDSHKVGIFFSGPHSGLCKNRDIHVTPHRFWS